jgi:small multidrug resistance pump
MEEIPVSWCYLLAAIVFEVCGTTCMKLSDGFKKATPSTLMWVFYVISFIALTHAIKRIEISVAYAIWAGLGTALIALIGIFWFQDSYSLLKVVSLALIIAGIVGLNLSGVAH